MTRTYQAAVGVRGDCLYCPLPLSIDSYWNCLTNCPHCCFRRLNRTWGQDLRPADPEHVRKVLENGLKNQNPKSTLAWALKLKKTLRLGSKSDPFQEAEKEHRVSERILEHLIDLRWSFAIQTRFVGNLLEVEHLLAKAHDLGLLTLIPVISPGAESDWEILERGLTTPIPRRLRILSRWIKRGWNIGVNGEPYIPGYHTPAQFRAFVKRLVKAGVPSYNTYNLHLNDYVAKQLHAIGIDIVSIWENNQDGPWRLLQQRLCSIATQEGIRLGCPDFVNTGWGWKEQANTCCGVNVPNPSLFNTHHWKKLKQDGVAEEEILNQTWEGIGERALAEKVVCGKKCQFYTMGEV